MAADGSSQSSNDAFMAANKPANSPVPSYVPCTLLQKHPTVHKTYENIAVRMYRKTSNISRTLVGHEIVDHSDVVGASPVGAAPTTSSFST